MANDVTTQSATLATIPASTVIATDQLAGGQHVQLVKLVDGTEDSSARLPGDATNGLKVNVTNATIAVTGTFWQATQPISAAALPLPTGAATAAKQPALGTAGTPSADVISVQGVGGGTAIPVSGTFWQATQPISGTVGVSGTVTVDSELTTADLDTGAGTDTRAVVGLVLAKSGGAANISSTDPLPVTVISGGGGGTQYAEDAVHASGDLGTVALTRRADTASSSAGTDGDYATLNTDASGRLHVNVGNTATVTQTPATSGGLTIYRLLSAGTTNANSVKASAGQVYGWYITNTNAAARFVKLYNKASAPTVGSDTPVMTLLIPGGTSGSGAIAAEFVSGIAFGTGIAIAITGLIADADTTAIGANDVIVNLMYK